MTLTDSLGWTLIHFLWQGAVIALLLRIADTWMSRAPAQARYGMACGALLSMLGAFMLTWWSFYVGAPGHGTVGSAVLTELPIPAARQWSLRQQVGDYLPFLAGLWATCVALLAVRATGAWATATRVALQHTRVASPVWQARLADLSRRLGVTRTVRLCESRVADVPMVIGWLRPVVLLPATALTGLSPRQLEALLAHELAHVRRHDYLVNLLQILVESLLFYHPATWWVTRRIRTEREHCCDDLAVAACGDAVLYARALAELELARQHTPVFALAATGGTVVARVQRLLHARDRDRSRIWPLAALMVLAMLAVAAVPYASQPSEPRDGQLPPVSTPGVVSSSDALLMSESAVIETIEFRDVPADVQARLRARIGLGVGDSLTVAARHRIGRSLRDVGTGMTFTYRAGSTWGRARLIISAEC